MRGSFLFVLVFLLESFVCQTGYASLLEEDQKDYKILSLQKFAQEIVRVTKAEPDIKRKIYYDLSLDLHPSLKSNGYLTGLWNGLWQSLLDPESLVEKEGVREAIRLKTPLTKEDDVFKYFKDADLKLKTFRERLLENKEIKEIIPQEKLLFFDDKLSKLNEFYEAFLEKVTYLINQLISTSDLSLSHQLEDFLEPKALMMGDIFTNNQPFRVSQSTARHMLKIDHHGNPIVSMNSHSTSNHRVSFLPKEEPSEAKIYFKSDGHPPLKPGKEAMIYHLYKHFNIPIPVTGLLLLDHILIKGKYNETPYIIQASEAIKGQSGKQILKSKSWKENISLLDKDLYVRQVIGSLLTDPCDGKPDNFIYSETLKSFISIDNDEVFEDVILKDKRVHLKSVLYSFPLMDEVIPLKTQQSFLTPLSEISLLSLFEKLHKRNSLYNQLFSFLKFHSRYREGGSLNETYASELSEHLSLPITMSERQINLLLAKLREIGKLFQDHHSLTSQNLLSQLQPLIGLYYKRLREISSSPYAAMEALYDVSSQEEQSYSILSSLIKDSEVFSDGTTVLEKTNQLFKEQALLNSSHPIEYLEDRFKKSLLSALSLDKVIMLYLQQWRADIFKGKRLLKDMELLFQEKIVKFNDEKLALEFWIRGTQKFKEQNMVPLLLKWDMQFKKFLVFNPELEWLIKIEDSFPSGWSHKGKYPKKLSEVKGAFLGRRVLKQEIAEHIFDSKGRFKKNPQLTGRGDVTCYPENTPLFYFKKNPEIPGYEYATTSFMRRLGLLDIPRSELLAFYHKDEGLYPVLVVQAMEGNPIYKIWDQNEMFSHLDPTYTGFLLLSAMLLNPEDGKEDNYLLSPDQKRLIPIDNDHAFLPGVIRTQGSFFSGYKIFETLQSKTLLFCLEEMLKPLPKPLVKYVTSLNIDAFLTSWMEDLVKVNERFQTLFPQEALGQLWEQKGVTLRIPFSDLYLKNLYFKFHTMQRILTNNPGILPIQILSILEPYVGKRYSETLKITPSLKNRFKFVTDKLYTNSNSKGVRLSVANSHQMMEISQITPKELIVNPMYCKQGPTYGLDKIRELIEQRKSNDKLTTSLREKDFSTLQKEHQLQFFGELRGKDLEEIIIRNSSHLSNKILQGFVLSSRLREMNLEGSIQLTEDILPILESECTGLECLNLSRTNIVNFAKGLLKNDPLTFNNLKKLDLYNCRSLKNLKMYVPELELLNLNNCVAFNLEKLMAIKPIIIGSQKLKYIQHPEINDLIVEISHIQDIFSKDLDIVDYSKVYELIRSDFYSQSSGDLLNKGWKYANGLGLPVDFRKGCIFYLLSNFKNELDIAYNNIGFMYQFCGAFGKEFELNARRHYTKGANLNELYATYALGFMHENGIGGEKDTKKGSMLYLKAHELGHIGASYHLCVNKFLEEEQSRKILSILASKGYLMAFSAGNPDAIINQNEWNLNGSDQLSLCNLGWVFESGILGEKNIEKAYKLYRKAAWQGDLVAQSLYRRVFYTLHPDIKTKLEQEISHENL